jgi:hypothetical protein
MKLNHQVNGYILTMTKYFQCLCFVNFVFFSVIYFIFLKLCQIFESLFIIVIKLNRIKYVGEVSNRFDFFQRIFTYLSVSKKLTSVSYRTRRALSSGTIRFSVDQSMAQKISKYRIFLIKFRHYIRVKATYIHLLHCVNSKDTCARYNWTSSIQWYTLFIGSLKYNF